MLVTLGFMEGKAVTMTSEGAHPNDVLFLLGVAVGETLGSAVLADPRMAEQMDSIRDRFWCTVTESMDERIAGGFEIQTGVRAPANFNIGTGKQGDER